MRRKLFLFLVLGVLLSLLGVIFGPQEVLAQYSQYCDNGFCELEDLVNKAKEEIEYARQQEQSNNLTK